MLKVLITEPKFFIEAKGKDGYWIDNYKHLIVSSNENWAVPLDPDDRRFFVLDISSEKKEDVEYFNALYHQLDHGGHEALMYDLMHEDLNGFDPKIMPENYLGFDMKLQSASSIDRFIYESLREGYWDHHRSEPFHIFNHITTKEFGVCYRSCVPGKNKLYRAAISLGKDFTRSFLISRLSGRDMTIPIEI